MNQRAVLIGGGEIRSDEGLLRRLRADDIFICADSGYLHCKRLGLRPRLLVGDFDSVGEVPEDVELLRYASEKDFTDTALAADWALEQGFRELLFAGMTGGRMDHSLANLQTMAYCARRGLSCGMTDGETDLYVFFAESTPAGGVIEPREEHYFSLFSLSETCHEVTIKGGRYPLDRYELRFDEARAVSNEFTGVPVQISFTGGTLLVVITPMNRSI